MDPNCRPRQPIVFTITPLAECHFEGLRATLDVVAREKQYLALTQAPPPDEAYAFYRNILLNNLVALVVIVEGRVVGWCDVLRQFSDARQHVGVLGIGLLPTVRHKGIGLPLIQSAIRSSWERDLERIELTVRCDNRNACELYKRVGFEVEGQHHQAFCVDGAYHDLYSMALLRHGRV